MAVSYKPLLHMMIEKNISNAKLMRRWSYVKFEYKLN